MCSIPWLPTRKSYICRRTCAIAGHIQSHCVHAAVYIGRTHHSPHISGIISKPCVAFLLRDFEIESKFYFCCVRSFTWFRFDLQFSWLSCTHRYVALMYVRTSGRMVWQGGTSALVHWALCICLHIIIWRDRIVNARPWYVIFCFSLFVFGDKYFCLIAWFGFDLHTRTYAMNKIKFRENIRIFIALSRWPCAVCVASWLCFSFGRNRKAQTVSIQCRNDEAHSSYSELTDRGQNEKKKINVAVWGQNMRREKWKKKQRNV